MLRLKPTLGNAVVCAVLLAAWLVPVASQANDASFGGAGGSLTAQNETRVQMRSEDILMIFDDYRWKVEAEYVFFNHASAAVTLQVGFPELRCEAYGDCGNVAFKNLTTHVDGKAITHRQGKLGDEQAWAGYLGVVWLFDVTFPPNREVRVRHTYSVSSGENVEGFTYTSYITKTGARWKGTIESARFRGRFPPFTNTVERSPSKGLSESPPIQTTDYVEYTLQGKNWVPREDVHLSFNVTPRMASGGADKDVLALTCFYGGRDKPPAQDCMNLLYATRGYPFESPALRAHYYSGDPKFRKSKQMGFRDVWVRDMLPLANFSERWFTQRDKPLLAELREQRASEAANSASGTTEGDAPASDGSPAAPGPAAEATSSASLPATSALTPKADAPSSGSTAATSPTNADPTAPKAAQQASPSATPETPTASPPAASESESKSTGGCAWSVASLSQHNSNHVLLMLGTLMWCRRRNTRTATVERNCRTVAKSPTSIHE